MMMLPKQSAAIISAVNPFPSDSGKSVVIAGLLRHLTKRLPAGGIHYLHVGDPIEDVSAFGQVVVHEMGRPGQLDRLRAVASAARPGGRSLQEAFLASNRVAARIKATLSAINADLEIVDTLRMNQYVENHQPRGFRVLYLDDLFSVRYRRMIELSDHESDTDYDPLGKFAENIPRVLRRFTQIRWTRRLLLSIESSRIERSEISAARAAELSLLLNEDEAEYLRMASGAQVAVIKPSLQSRSNSMNLWNGRPNYVFIGLLSLAHNHDGLVWFLRQGMSALLREQPNAVLHVIGRGAAPSLLSAAEPFGEHVRFRGFVDDIDTALGESCALVNTLRFGSGIKIKTLDALARGIPVVTTSCGAEGISNSSRAGLTIVADAASAGLALARLSDSAIRKSEAEGALQFFESRFSTSVVESAYDRVFGTVASSTGGTP